MAYKSGYLMKKSKTFYKGWSERFYVLSNIGLIYMFTPESKDVRLFPFVDFQVKEEPQATYNMPYVLKLKTTKKSDDMIMRAKSKEEYDGWLAAF